MGPGGRCFFVVVLLPLSLAPFLKLRLLSSALLYFSGGVAGAYWTFLSRGFFFLWLLVSFCYNPWHRCISLEL